MTTPFTLLYHDRTTVTLSVNGEEIDVPCVVGVADGAPDHRDLCECPDVDADDLFAVAPGVDYLAFCDAMQAKWGEWAGGNPHYLGAS